MDEKQKTELVNDKMGHLELKEKYKTVEKDRKKLNSHRRGEN